MINLQIRQLPYRIHKELAMLLDVPGNKDWKALISVLPDGMYNMTQIAMLENAGKAQGGSSASELLCDLGHQLMTVKELIGYLERMNHQEALLLIKPPEPVKITKQPESVVAQCGERVKLKCVAKGFPRPTYQWYRDEEELDEGFSNELIINSVSQDHEGEYYCKSTNKIGSEYTNKVTLQVTPPVVVPLGESQFGATRPNQQPFLDYNHPAIRQDENNTMTRTVYPGERFRLTCDDDNRPYLLYQWFKNGYIIPGANYKDLEFNPFQHGDEGYYTCRMTGPDGDLLSRLTQLQLGTTNIAERKFATGKIALLIGNQKYTVSRYNDKELVHPEDDAQCLASALIRIGFKVLCLVNLTKDEMIRAVEGFCNLLRISEGMYGFFYFGGHGFEENGKTYLVPVDAPKEWDQSVAICAENVLAQMQSSKTKLDVLVLDVCRLPSGSDGVVDTKKDFEPPFQAGAQSVICYATCPQSQAFERRYDANGIYVKHLLQHIHEDDQLETMLHRVCADVRKEAVRNHITAFQSPSHFTTTFEKFSLRDPVIPDLDKDPTLPWFEHHRLPPAHVLEFDHGIRVELKFQSICSNVCELSLHITNMGESLECGVSLLKLSAGDLQISPEEMNKIRPVTLPFVARSNPYAQERDTRSMDYENVTRIPSLQRLKGNMLLVIEVTYRIPSGEEQKDKILNITNDEFGITSLFY